MPRRKGSGAKPKINSDVVEKMKSYMIAGLTLKDACFLLEIGYHTWNDYERAHPEIRTKRKAWQGMLKAQAQANIAKMVMNEKDPQWSSYVLDRAERLEDKKARNALARAQAKKTKAEADIAEKQASQLNTTVDYSAEKMKKLTVDELKALARLGSDDDDN